jgi:hypothetical protein
LRDRLISVNAYFYSVSAKSFKLYFSIDFGKKGEVFSQSYIIAGMKFRTHLAGQNISSQYQLSAKTFNSKPLALTISTITGTALSFFYAPS